MMKGKGRENGFPTIICQGMYMKYAIKVNEVKKENGNVKGFATVVFGDSFKITKNRTMLLLNKLRLKITKLLKIRAGKFKLWRFHRLGMLRQVLLQVIKIRVTNNRNRWQDRMLISNLRPCQCNRHSQDL